MSTTMSAMSVGYGDQVETMPYRALSRSAVVSVALGLISILGYLFEPMLVVAAAGLVMGLLALRAIKRYPLEYTGIYVAIVGINLSGGILLTGAALHTFIYLTEVPEGYQRISFSELQPDLLNEPGRPIPSQALTLDGKKIFVKGYTHKFIQSMGKVDHFVLVPDLGECCFGDKATKPTHMIEVKVTDPRYRVQYALRRIKPMGTFHVTEYPIDDLGLGGIFYRLEADKVH